MLLSKCPSKTFLFWTLITLLLGCGRTAREQIGQNSLHFAVKNSESALTSPANKDVIVQLFNWPFRQITSEIPNLSAMGYGQIHVSPPNLTIDSDQWWGRYQPVDYRAIAGPLGDQNEFSQMIQTAHDYGLRIIVDIVFNHTANESSRLPTEAFALNKKFGPLFTSQDYNPPFCITNYNDVAQVRNGRLCGGGGDRGLPDLNQASERVLLAQRTFLKLLLSLGVDGFRLDAVKHMEPGYFKKLLTEDTSGKAYVFGEIIADSSTYDRDLAPYIQETTMSFYDFPLRDTVQKAFSLGGSLASLVDSSIVSQRRALPWNRSVTFVVNHDIPNNDGFRSMIMDPVDESLAYAFLLGRAEGVPYIFSDLGVKAGGGIREDRWAYAHRSPKLVSMISFHNAVHGTDMRVLKADDCQVIFSRGNTGLVGINKCGEARSAFVKADFPVGQSYRDLLGGDEIKQQGPFVEVKIPPRSAVMYLKL